MACSTRERVGLRDLTAAILLSVVSAREAKEVRSDVWSDETVGNYVEDQEKAVAFDTHTLGFEIRRSLSMGPYARWVEVAPPGAQSCPVLSPKAMMANWTELKPAVVFHCPVVEAACRRLELLAVRITRPTTTVAWETLARFLDPDGNELGLTSQKSA